MNRKPQNDQFYFYAFVYQRKINDFVDQQNINKYEKNFFNEFMERQKSKVLILTPLNALYEIHIEINHFEMEHFIWNSYQQTEKRSRTKERIFFFM